MNYRELFPVIDRHTWLNHAAISPWPAAGRRRDAGIRRGISRIRAAALREVAETEAASSPACAADFLGADPDDIALIKNTSEGLSLIAAGLDWQPGDALVCCSRRFSQQPACRGISSSRTSSKSAKSRSTIQDPESGLLQALERRACALLAVSSVRYDSGVRLTWTGSGRGCARSRRAAGRRRDPAPGRIAAGRGRPRRSISSSAAATSGCWRPKAWRCSGRGRRRAASSPLQTGWRMWPDMFNFERVRLARPESARRFEPGTLNMAGIHGLDAALSDCCRNRPETRAEQLLDRTGWLIDGPRRTIPGVRIITPRDRAATRRHCLLQTGPRDPDAVLKKLAAARSSPPDAAGRCGFRPISTRPRTDRQGAGGDRIGMKRAPPDGVCTRRSRLTLSRSAHAPVLFQDSADDTPRRARTARPAGFR